jgi:hypothetical protein
VKNNVLGRHCGQLSNVDCVVSMKPKWKKETMLNTRTLASNKVFTLKRPVVMLCCNYCDRIMAKAWLTLWKEDKNGVVSDVTFLHYHCQAPFELEHPGHWLSRGCPARHMEL